MPVKTTTVKKRPGRKAPASSSKVSRKSRSVKLKDPGQSYDEHKEFEGKQYTGMKVGRSHKWYYDKGEWKETKITPDLWEISYAVTKRRAGKAPEGSGVPVGTEYHWYILAHQNVRKLNADDYSTSMVGLKFKLAHKRADHDKWSTTAKTQRKRLIQLMQDFIKQLQQDPIPVVFELDGTLYQGEAVPIPQTCHDGRCSELDVSLNDREMGIIKRLKSGWKIDGVEDKKLLKAIGSAIDDWYENK